MPAPATTMRSGVNQVRMKVARCSLRIASRLSSGQSSGLPSVLSRKATVCRSSGRFISGLLVISPISYRAASFCAASSSSESSGCRIVSARSARTREKSLWKNVDWYMIVSRADEHITFPPSASISEIICSAVRFLVDCFAREREA